MKQETNNEMDLLLRRLGRRQDVFTPGNHLDPDELNAYAENALPAAARARYTEHLAECSPCRELVVQLSASAGVVVAPQTATVLEPSALRKFLASLFSPMVLRYAVPALGLIVVAAIGVFVLNQNRTARDYVSQVQNEQAKPAAAEPVGPPQQEQATKTDDSSISKDSRVAGKTAPQSTPAPITENAPAGAVAQNAPAPKPESQPATAAPAESRPANPAATTEEKQQKNEDISRQKEAEVKVAEAEESKKNFILDKDEKRADEPRRSGMTPGAAKSKVIASADSVSRGAGTITTQSRARGERDDKDTSAETKTVAGHHFRKQGDVWIDTAYDRSGISMTVSRGSERYQSLIADEPAIKTIADQLDGEIIVVWKGRAYRIR